MIKLYKYGLLIREKESILLCKAYNLRELILPGGVKENNEDFVEGLQREVKEELSEGANLIITSLNYLGNYIAPAAGKIDTLVEIELYEGIVTGTLVASDEIEELVWFNKNSDHNNLSEIIKDKILPDLIARGILRWSTK